MIVTTVYNEWPVLRLHYTQLVENYDGKVETEFAGYCTKKGRMQRMYLHRIDIPSTLTVDSHSSTANACLVVDYESSRDEWNRTV
jgi:hypothetical protein